MNFIFYGLPVKRSQYIVRKDSRTALLRVCFERGDVMGIEVTGDHATPVDMHVTFVDCGRNVPPRYSVVSAPVVTDGARPRKTLDSGQLRENAGRA